MIHRKSNASSTICWIFLSCFYHYFLKKFRDLQILFLQIVFHFVPALILFKVPLDFFAHPAYITYFINFHIMIFEMDNLYALYNTYRIITQSSK